MNSRPNPYNCSKPGNLFVGYTSERPLIARRLAEGKSYAILGGKRCGKTSLLLKIAEDLDASKATSIRLLPRMLDMQAVVPRSPADFFRAIYALTVEGAQADPWSGVNYQDFLARLDKAKSLIEDRHGRNWTVVLLIDELDAASSALPDSEAFQNLRNLLMTSRYSQNFRVVATGISSLSKLITDRSSPLNNLDPLYLGALPRDAAAQLVEQGYGKKIDAQLEASLYSRTGGHPYILQGLLEYLWDADAIDEACVSAAVRRFVRDRAGTFQRWVADFKGDGSAVYAALQDRPLSMRQLRARVPLDLSPYEGLEILRCHALVDDSDPDGIRNLGSIFREWFRENQGIEAAASQQPVPALTSAAAPSRDRKVFVVYGRNDRLRVALFTFLRSVGLAPLEWTDLVEATGNPAPHIAEILKKGFEIASAAVVLFSPDDEARLRPEFCQPDDPAYESELHPQPRPNVIFEAGMAMALFRDRTILVQAGQSRPFSDLAGVHYVKIDNTMARRKDLLNRLKLAGCPVTDATAGTEWQTAGDFSLPDFGKRA